MEEALVQIDIPNIMKYSTKRPPKISDRIYNYILISSPAESEELLKFIPNTIE